MARVTRKRRSHGRGPLMTACLDLLEKTDTTALEIFYNTGITPDWLHRFKAGKIPDPGINRVEHLYLYLCVCHEVDPRSMYKKDADLYRAEMNFARQGLVNGEA